MASFCLAKTRKKNDAKKKMNSRKNRLKNFSFIIFIDGLSDINTPLLDDFLMENH